MNLLKIEDIPTVHDVDITFSTLNADPKLLSVAIENGFDDWNNPWSKMFSKIFYDGGSVQRNPKIAEDDYRKVIRYLKALSKSFNPKHEHKTAICALLLSEVCVLNK